MDTEQLRKDLERDEGRRRFAYDDRNGLALLPGQMLRGQLTIGVGWNLTARGLPETVIDRLLDLSISSAEQDVLAILGVLTWPTTISEPRQRALTNMAFNLGRTKLTKFTRMWAAVRAGEWDAAAQYALASKWATQVGRRAQRIVALLREG